MHELDLYHHTIIGYKFRGGVFFQMQKLNLYHHTIIGDEFRAEMF